MADEREVEIQIIDEDEGKETETEGVGHVQSFFVEKDQVVASIIRLCGSSLPFERETILGEITKILLKYQEQAHLLGPHIEDLMRPVNDALVYFAISTPVHEKVELFARL